MFTPFARAAAATGLVLALAGCTSSAHWTSIFRTAELDWGTTLITDAKQRVIINVPASQEYGRNRPTRIICAEPSPDVAQALSDSISAALKVEVAGKGGGAASFGRSTAEAVAQLGERLGTIQLLRDGLYRACEAYANGAINNTTYAMIVSRYDNTMVTLLMGELAAGAFGRSGAVISAAASGAAQAGGGAASETAIKDFQEKQKAFEKAEKTHSDEEKILQGLKDEKKPEKEINAQQQKVDAAKDARDEAKDKRDLALKVLGGSVGAATSARGLGGQAMGAIKTAAATSKAAGAVLQGMHKAFLENDERDFSPVVKACVTTLDSRPAPANAEAMFRFKNAIAAYTQARKDGKDVGKKRLKLQTAAAEVEMTGWGIYCLTDVMPTVMRMKEEKLTADQTKAQKALKSMVTDVGEVVKKTREILIEIKSVSTKTIKEIKAAVQKIDFEAANRAAVREFCTEYFMKKGPAGDKDTLIACIDALR